MTTQTDALVAYAHSHDFKGPRAVVPRRHVAIVTCMDSRIDNFHIFGLDIGEAHVLRNAGGIVTDDILRSLVFSQRFLKTREVILMHHTHCGLTQADDAELRAELRDETGEEPPYHFGTFTDVDAAVARAIVRVREHVFLRHRDRVRGFVYDVDTGHVREITVD